MTESAPPHDTGSEPGQRSTRALVVMARAPRRGAVKTRLAREIGATAALAVYRELAECVLRALHGPDRYERVLQYTPADAEADMRAWAGGDWLLAPQCDGSLGDRMASAVAERFATGADRVVIVGTDCPAVDAPLVRDAFAALDQHDVVFGPARDGGYYLVGMRRGSSLHPARLFEDVPWSTPGTLAANVDRASALGLTVARLPEHRDVDSREDLEHWRAHRSAARAATDAPRD